MFGVLLNDLDQIIKTRNHSFKAISTLTLPADTINVLSKEGEHIQTSTFSFAGRKPTLLYCCASRHRNYSFLWGLFRSSQQQRLAHVSGWRYCSSSMFRAPQDWTVLQTLLSTDPLLFFFFLPNFSCFVLLCPSLPPPFLSLSSLPHLLFILPSLAPSPLPSPSLTQESRMNNAIFCSVNHRHHRTFLCFPFLALSTTHFKIHSLWPYFFFFITAGFLQAQLCLSQPKHYIRNVCFENPVSVSISIWKVWILTSTLWPVVYYQHQLRRPCRQKHTLPVRSETLTCM